jgi:predicted DNA-binding protein
MTMPATTTVRVRIETSLALTRLASQRGLAKADLLAEIVEHAEQDELLEQMNASYERQLGDGVAAHRELAERELWRTKLPRDRLSEVCRLLTGR